VRQVFTLTSLPYFTHPVFASLDHPLFCRQKEGKNILKDIFLKLIMLQKKYPGIDLTLNPDTKLL